MDSFEQYLESLSFDDIGDISVATDPETTVALRLDKATIYEKNAAENIDKVIANAPTLTEPVTIYKQLQSYPNLREGGELTEPAFLYGNAKKPAPKKGVDILAIEVPTGTHVLKLPGDGYVLGRGLKMELETTETGIIPTTIG